MKKIDENLIQHLTPQGSVVYVQNPGRTRDKGVKLLSIVDNSALDVFEKFHEKVVSVDEVKKYAESGQLASKFYKNGTQGVVIAGFHIRNSEEQIEKMLEEGKISSKEEAKSSVYSLIVFDDDVVISDISTYNVYNN